MFNVCPACGEYAVEKEIDPGGPYAICPHCGHAHPFVMLPLFVVTGASGSGKTTICSHLVRRLLECVVVESDILWRAEFATPDDGYRGYRDLCLRVAKNVSQAGRPVVLCGSALPEQFEGCPERRYFSATHYLAVVCEDEALRRRLLSRPAWRQSVGDEFVARHIAFNRWLRDHGRETDPPMSLLDTTDLDAPAAAEAVRRWVLGRLTGQARGGQAGRPAAARDAPAVSPLKAEALAILGDLDLVTHLARYGRAEVVGSVALDLLVKLDIDVHLLTERDLFSVADATYRYLLGHERVREVRITDCRDRGSLKLAVDRCTGPSGDWKIDIWVTNRPETVHFADTARLAEALTSQQRRSILAIKRHYHARGELLGGLSTRIYDAVVSGGIRTVADFRRWSEGIAPRRRRSS